MAEKKNGMPYVVHPSPMKGKDGHKIVYVRPEGGPRMKLTVEQMDAICAKYSSMRSGKLRLVLGASLCTGPPSGSSRATAWTRPSARSPRS